MITYIDSQNSKEYRILFDDATKYLKEQGVLTNDVAITTLEEYFGQLKYLLGVEAENLSFYDIVHSEGRRFTMLPLDENRFVINANTRTIEVPNDFKKNGIAVQGDKLSEVIYFEIDRFFDATDLDTCDIYVQWEAANGDRGASVPWVVDIYSKPNKIIFGWALSDEITETAGTIKFAVRFFKWEDLEKTKLSYSLSTLTATANIKPALNFELATGEFLREIATDDVIVQRIRDSKTTITNGAQAGKAVFILDLAKEADLDPNKEYFLANGEPESGAYELIVQALSPDAGLISYQWYKVLGGDQNDPITNPKNYGTRFEITTDTVESIRKDLADKKEKIYYEVQDKENSMDLGALVPIDIEEVINDVDAEERLKNIYELFAWCLVGATGTYKCVASNRKGLSSTESNSTYCTVPAPSHPEITDNLETSEILGLDEEGQVVPVELAIEVKADGQKSYQWYRVYGTNIANEQTELLEGATEATLEVSEIGKYYVEATNTRNKHELTEKSAVAKVSFAAEEPVITYPNFVQEEGDQPLTVFFNSIQSGISTELDKIRIDLDSEQTSNQYLSENVTYQWFTTEDNVQDESDTPVSVNNGGQSPRLFPTARGNYYCKVTNHLNGTTASKNSEFIFVV